MKLLELIESRKSRLDSIIPTKKDDAIGIDQIQGDLYNNSLNAKAIMKHLIPLIQKSAAGIPTKNIVDAWLKHRAELDFKKIC
jgi:hypothetical protein